MDSQGGPGNEQLSNGQIEAGKNPRDAYEGDTAASQVKQEEDNLARKASTVQPPFTIYTKHQRNFIVALVSIAGFFSPLNSNIVSWYCSSRTFVPSEQRSYSTFQRYLRSPNP